MSDTQNLLKEYREKISSFNEEQIGDISLFFSDAYSKKYITSREEAFDIILNEGIPKALSKLDDSKKMEIKKKILSI